MFLQSGVFEGNKSGSGFEIYLDEAELMALINKNNQSNITIGTINLSNKRFSYGKKKLDKQTG
ncbi:MAG: hypothetical protein D5R98_05760 [Desulfonatronovibrio sp. MSAO_Bac4]|nr:MAG: hypothetical protein D5R98_05760 [Desulfonatronovibrio sp. MSAO_Bac4]